LWTRRSPAQRPFLQCVQIMVAVDEADINTTTVLAVHARFKPDPVCVQTLPSCESTDKVQIIHVITRVHATIVSHQKTVSSNTLPIRASGCLTTGARLAP